MSTAVSGETTSVRRSFTRYLPRLSVEWAVAWPGDTWRALDGTLVFADVSGFTSLSERLARRGPVGAEELTDVLGECFSRLLALAYADDGSLLKFGGDALLLLFTGPDHAGRACRAAARMRREMRAVGRLVTSVGSVRLRMSVGVHTGELHFFRVGGSHRELIVTGPAATATVTMEAAAEAGEILVSPATASALGSRSVGATKGPGRLLRDVTVDLGDVGGFPAAPDASIDVTEAIPVALRPHLASGSLEPEHRHASMAFVHFDGVDGLLERAGPGAVAIALDDLVRRAQLACAEEEVTFLATDIDRDGGKIILVTGVPRALADDEGRLLRAVRRIADGAGADLPVRIGVNRGHVFAGEIGPPYRRTFTVMGDAVNLAARLMAAARPGQILATAGVVERSKSAFELASLPPFAVKGKARPVQAFAVGALQGRGRVTPVVPVTARPGLPLVGREREMGVLLAAVDAARAGTGTLVEVVGEPGIGKSRLLEEVRRRAGDLHLVTFACEAYESSTPYRAVGEVVRELLGVPPGASTRVVGSHLARAVGSLAPDLAPWLPLLGAVLELDLPATEATASLEARFRRERTRIAVVDLLAALLPGPTLMLLDDVQWMDEASADLLAHLATGLRDRPWAVVVARLDGPGGFRAPVEAPASLLPVDPLPTDDAAALVAAATDDAPLRPTELAALLARGGGNPLFLEELLRAGVATGEALPDSLDAVLSVQIDRLPPAPRRLLQFAAVLGTGFARPLLAAVVEDDLLDDLSDALAELAEFLETDGPDVRFRHRLTRDVAYEKLSFRRRRALHARAGDAIESSSANAAAEQAELLSLHFLAAQRHREAWRYSLLAAQRAQRKFANADAAELYERAVAAAQNVPGIGPRELAGVWESLGDVRQLAGHYAEASVAYRAARRLLGDEPVDLARLCLKQAQAAERQGGYTAGVRWARRGLRLLEGLDAPEAAAQRAQLGVWYATIRQRQGRHHEAIRWCHRAIDEANTGGDRQALARAYRVLDWAYVDLGQLDRATNSAEALAIYEELGDLAGQAEVLNNLGGFAYYQGRWQEALELYARHGDAKLRTGNEVDAALSKVNMAEILAEQGRLDEAEAGFRAALRTWRAVRYPRWIAFATMHLGRVLARAGRHGEAVSLLEQARAGFAAIEAAAEALETDTWLAECHLLHGDAARALALAEDALRREAAMGGAGLHRATLERIRGYAFAQLGRTSDAWAALDESLAVARARRAPYEVALTLEALSVIASLRGEPYRPPEDEHRRVLDRLGVRWLPAVPVPMPGPTLPTAGPEGPAPGPAQ